MTASSSTLFSECHYGEFLCRCNDCKHAVKQEPTSGRWYITFGHAGANLPRNNRDGYPSATHARQAMVRLLNGFRR